MQASLESLVGDGGNGAVGLLHVARWESVVRVAAPFLSSAHLTSSPVPKAQFPRPCYKPLHLFLLSPFPPSPPQLRSCFSYTHSGLCTCFSYTGFRTADSHPCGAGTLFTQVEDADVVEVPGMFAQAEVHGMFTQAEVHGMFTQAEVHGMFTQAEVHGMFTHAEVHGMFTQAEVHGMLTQAEVHGILTQAEMHGMFTQAEVHGMLIQAEVHGMFTQAEVHGMFTQAEVHGMLTQAEVHGMLTQAEVHGMLQAKLGEAARCWESGTSKGSLGVCFLKSKQRAKDVRGLNKSHQQVTGSSTLLGACSYLPQGRKREQEVHAVRDVGCPRDSAGPKPRTPFPTTAVCGLCGYVSSTGALPSSPPFDIAARTSPF
ncbi:unnamed protein product [Closterium sp. NIES-64]|nr:unnamed protein product [Closterium sp. NIES-64]